MLCWPKGAKPFDLAHGLGSERAQGELGVDEQIGHALLLADFGGGHLAESRAEGVDPFFLDLQSGRRGMAAVGQQTFVA